MTKISFNKGDRVRCISDGGRGFQLMHSPRNRIVIGKVYKVAWFDETLGNLGLQNKGSNWHHSRFIKVEPVTPQAPDAIAP